MHSPDFDDLRIDRLYKDQDVTFEVTQDSWGKSRARLISAKPPFRIVPVFYATDRKRTARSEPNAIFANLFGQKLAFGIAEVAIPETHKIGHLETPSIWRLEFRADPQRHVALLAIEHLAEPEFVSRLQDMAGASQAQQALIFIHGYNVSFASAIRRAAQLAIDLKIEGPVMAYSWASHANPRRYPDDGTNSERTIPFLRKFLELVAEHSGVQSIYLIAHSMGNRALVYALQQIVSNISRSAVVPFREAILAAPDIDKTVFEQMAQQFRGAAHRFTIYASRNDRALNLARHFHGYPRAGHAGDGIVVVSGMDSIDASAVDTSFVGHSYYGSERSVLDDIFEIIKTGFAADKRYNLAPVEGPSGRFWRFRP